MPGLSAAPEHDRHETAQDLGSVRPRVGPGPLPQPPLFRVHGGAGARRPPAEALTATHPPPGHRPPCGLPSSRHSPAMSRCGRAQATLHALTTAGVPLTLIGAVMWVLPGPGPRSSDRGDLPGGCVRCATDRIRWLRRRSPHRPGGPRVSRYAGMCSQLLASRRVSQEVEVDGPRAGRAWAGAARNEAFRPPRRRPRRLVRCLGRGREGTWGAEPGTCDAGFG